MSAEPMLDPSWTPARGYGHAAALVALCDSFPTTPHEGREQDVREKKSATVAPSDKSTKVSARHYRIASRLAKRDRRSIKTTIELAIEKLEAEGSTS